MSKIRLNIHDCCGDWALVTGASSGIGVEFCRQLAQAKMNIVLVARRKDRLEVLAKKLAEKESIKTLVISQDLSLMNSARDIKNTIDQNNIKIRLLVNNAGWGLWGKFKKHQPLDIQNMVTLNSLTPMLLCSYFLEHLQTFPASAIINLSSPAALQPMPYKAVYGAAKAALHQWSLALYEELKPKNIHVLTVMPGPTQSELDEKGKAYPCKLTELREHPQRLVHLTLDGLNNAKPFVTSARGIYQQRLFNGLFPYSTITRYVADMFTPKDGWKD